MDIHARLVFRLVSRGEAGPACDEDGVALGDIWLVRPAVGEGQRMEVRSPEALTRVIRDAYGVTSPSAARQVHRGLKRAATQLEVGNLALASMETLMIGLSRLTAPSVAKLALLASLEKSGAAWEDEPRVPAGRPDGGQWTTGGGETAVGGSQVHSAQSAHPWRVQGVYLDDGVYHPDQDRPQTLLTGGAEDAYDGFRQGIGGNEPPYDFMELSELFPGLKDQPGVIIPLAPVDSFLGISGLAEEANLQASSAIYGHLLNQIEALRPGYIDNELQPFADMSWQGRSGVINKLLMDRAVAYYSIRHDLEPLQVETVRFLQQAVDKAYQEAISDYKGSALPGNRDWKTAVGQQMDATVRENLQQLFNGNGIQFGPGRNITVNNRDGRADDQTYRVPDARLGNVSIDWSLTPKTLSSGQVRGFFRADSAPDYVVIIRPSQLGAGHSYVITRPDGEIRRMDDADAI